MKSNRYNNLGLWLSLAALACLVLQDLGFTLNSERVDAYVKVISQIMIILGIVNNPTTENKWYADDNGSEEDEYGV